MDWLLSIITALANSGLGWSKGATWAWYVHAVNSILWIGYAILIEQYGLILLSVATIIIDVVSANRKKVV